MRHQLREQLVELAERLRLHGGRGEDRARELSGQITDALDGEDHDGLGDPLTEYVVEFEGEHPELAADALGAAGI